MWYPAEKSSGGTIWINLATAATMQYVERGNITNIVYPGVETPTQVKGDPKQFAEWANKRWRASE